jgi:Ca2+-binding EF-hand superfamily protein
MREFAAQQGADYQIFVDKLTSSLNQHQKLLKDFSNENQKLKNNRRQIQIDSMLALSNSFQNWDKKVGLSQDEFSSYMEMLGPNFMSVLNTKFGSLAGVFKKLDVDGSGTLNISELRTLLNDLVEEEREHQ